MSSELHRNQSRNASKEAAYTKSCTDLEEIFQYFIESCLEEIYEEARANEIRLSGYGAERAK